MDPILGSPAIRVKSAEGLTGGDAHRRFAAWRELPDAERACGSRAHAYVPFGAALRSPVVVVLARCSAPERVRLIADSTAVGGTHRTGCRERFSMLCTR